MLTIGTLSLVFETAVAVLLAVMIIFAIKLNRRLGQMREREAQMRSLIEDFNNAAVRAQDSAANLKAVGNEAERSLRGLVDRAQALRDELMFMIDRGDRLGAKIDKSVSTKNRGSSLKVAPAKTAVPAPADDEDLNLAREKPRSGEGVSRAELDLKRALRTARGGR